MTSDRDREIEREPSASWASGVGLCLEKRHRWDWGRAGHSAPGVLCGLVGGSELNPLKTQQTQGKVFTDP